MNGSLGISRPSSEQMRDLHVYVIPPELWRQHLRSAANEVITDSISLGFLRIAPHIHLQELRQEIAVQLGEDYLPKDYAFLKSVGRCLTQVKTRQERELKVKHFLPPYAYAPELFILDAHADSMRDSPSTIFQHSLTGTSLPKTGSKADSTGYQSGNRTASKYPSSQHESPTHTYRAPRQNGDFKAAEDSQYHPQASDQLPNKSSYPTYSHPYSHDISALTNAHRNQIDTSRSYDPYNNKGSETYRKHTDESSGYQSIPSPKKLSESPPRLHHGDNSMARKLNQGSSSLNHSYQDRVGENASESPRRMHGDDVSPDRHRSVSPESPNRKGESNHGSPERFRNDADERGEGDNSNYERQERGREMVSATPTSSPTKFHVQAEQDLDKVEREGTHSREMLESNDDLDDQDGRTPNNENSPNKERSSTSSEEKRELMRQLQRARDERLASEKKREELVKKARAMQAKTNNRRNQAREVWKKKYYEAKKQTPGLEADCQKLRAALDSLHRKHLTALENVPVDDKQKENYQLEAAKLQHDVDELQRKADAAKMKLTAEMKLRNQAETELRALRAELAQKKMNMNLSRAQKINSIGNSVLSVSSQP